MEDLIGRMNHLKRPRILIDAARSMAERYDRRRDLPRLLGKERSHGAAMIQLLEIEAAQESARKTGARAYRVQRHITVLSALIAEDSALRSRTLDLVR
jgi:hypothetical protein